MKPSKLSSPYVVWQFNDIPHSLVLDRLQGVENIFELVEGVPRASSFPSDARFTADPDFPDDIALMDAFTNTYHLTVVSANLKEFIASREPEKVEFLPVSLLDHKLRRAGDYFILHPIEPVEALDIDKSGAEWDIVDDSVIDTVQRIALIEEKLEPNRQVFKLKYLYDLILVQRDLAKAIDSAGFTGIEWVECQSFSR